MHAWIDLKGNFGLANFEGNVTEGTPEGKIKLSTYSLRYCSSCKKPFTIVENLKICPKCNSDLLTGREVLERVINRERCWKIELPPFKNKSFALACPKCEIGSMSYTQYFLMD